MHVVSTVTTTIVQPKSDQERAVVYVDIGPNSIQCRPQLNTCYSDDDKVVYSNIVHQPMNSKKNAQFQVDISWDKSMLFLIYY